MIFVSPFLFVFALMNFCSVTLCLGSVILMLFVLLCPALFVSVLLYQVQCLLELGASPNARNYYNQTALHRAAAVSGSFLLQPR